MVKKEARFAPGFFHLFRHVNREIGEGCLQPFERIPL